MGGTEPKGLGHLDHGGGQGVELMTSPITLAEVCMKEPASRELLIEFQNFCQGTDGVRFEPVYFDDVFAYRIANIGRTHKLQVADAFQVAFAELHGCDAILTNDNRLAQRSPVRGICLDRLALT